MHFNTDNFINSLAQEKLSEQEAGMRVYEEIRKAENHKDGFLDQATENPDFYKLMSNEVDRYVTELKAVHNRLAPQPEYPDQERFLAEQPDIDRILELEQVIKEAAIKRTALE